jgi:hypothetical protein
MGDKSAATCTAAWTAPARHPAARGMCSASPPATEGCITASAWVCAWGCEQLGRQAPREPLLCSLLPPHTTCRMLALWLQLIACNAQSNSDSGTCLATQPAATTGLRKLLPTAEGLLPPCVLPSPCPGQTRTLAWPAWDAFQSLALPSSLCSRSTVPSHACGDLGAQALPLALNGPFLLRQQCPGHLHSCLLTHKRKL